MKLDKSYLFPFLHYMAYALFLSQFMNLYWNEGNAVFMDNSSVVFAFVSGITLFGFYYFRRQKEERTQQMGK